MLLAELQKAGAVAQNVIRGVWFLPIRIEILKSRWRYAYSDPMRPGSCSRVIIKYNRPLKVVAASVQRGASLGELVGAENASERFANVFFGPPLQLVRG